eukprot:31419-Pelagococcus_subviridis.AAC.2
MVHVGVEFKGVRSEVERRRGRGLKARCERRETPGEKVLKDRRSPRQRGRMGTSVTPGSRRPRRSAPPRRASRMTPATNDVGVGRGGASDGGVDGGREGEVRWLRTKERRLPRRRRHSADAARRPAGLLGTNDE